MLRNGCGEKEPPLKLKKGKTFEQTSLWESHTSKRNRRIVRSGKREDQDEYLNRVEIREVSQADDERP